MKSLPCSCSLTVLVVVLSLGVIKTSHAQENNETTNIPIRTQRSQKRGLIMNKQIIQSSAEHFRNDASWFYNYMQAPLNWQGDWADANGIEFVPMIPQPWLNHVNGTKKCVFPSMDDPTVSYNGWNKLDLCTTQGTIDTLAHAKAERSSNARGGGVGMHYLMGFNEMYNNPPPVGKDITPQEAAYYWRIFIQPAAVANGLKLVSPTVGKTKKAMKWFASFLKQCYARRNDSKFPCSIELIQKFALHHYDCREIRWRTWFGGDESKLMKGLTKYLGTYGGKQDWGEYVRSRDIWVTETNCYWENNRKGLPKPGSKEQCLRITGQKSNTHGIGSLATMEQLSNIERYSWWTMWNEEIKPNYLAYFDGQISPIGRAYMRPGDTSVDCNYLNGEQMDVDEAIVSDPAELFTCKATATLMVRINSHHRSVTQMTFNLNLSRGGDYAINISYLSPSNNRFLTIAINDQRPVYYELRNTGVSDCENGGSSTVVAVQVEGFVKGMNSINLGNDGDNLAPMIEWISVVVPTNQ